MNRVAKFLWANTVSKVISGAILYDGGGCYVLENGVRYDWSLADMKKFIENGGEFEPVWKVTAG